LTQSSASNWIMKGEDSVSHFAQTNLFDHS
jgi:hypothetical protein